MKTVESNTTRLALLVYPGDKKYKTGKYAQDFFPMGLLYVAAAILEAEVDVKYINMNDSNSNKIVFEDYIFIGFTVMTGNMISKSLRLAKIIKKNNPDIPIVFGGVHPTILPKQTLENQTVDFIIVGEGDETIKEFIYELQNSRDFHKVKGLGYKINGEIIINQRRDFIDLNSLKIDLPYEIFGINKKRNLLGAFPVHTSRGCLYRCSFCYNAGVNKRRYRKKDAQRVIKEIEYLRNKYNINNFTFGNEDEFFIDTKRVLEISKQLINRRIKPTWGAFCRFDNLENISSDELSIINKSGCSLLVLGGESGSQRLLDNIIKKDLKVDQIIQGVKRLKEAKIPHIVSFMCCFPSETIKEIKETIKLIEKIYVKNKYLWVQSIFMLTPLPGTEIFDLLKNKYNYTAPNSLKEWGKYEMPFTSWKLISWHNDKYAKLCNELHIWSTYNPFYYLNHDNCKRINYFQNNRSPYLINRIMGMLQGVRIKLLFFKYPYEHIIFSYIFGLNTIYKNRIGLIPFIVGSPLKLLNLMKIVGKVIINQFLVLILKRDKKYYY